MSDLKVSLLQINPKWEDKDHNLRHIDELLTKTPFECDLLVLPEMFSTGFTMNPEPHAESTHGQTLAWMQEWAQKQSCLVAGSIIVKEAGDFYNRFVAVSSEGLVAQYDKRHLFRMGGEESHYASGSERIVFSWRGWRILPQICYDLRFPVWQRNQNDYDLMVLVASWPKPRQAVWNNLLVARSLENQTYVIASNRIGADNNGIEHAGDSQVIDPKGQIMVHVGEEEGLIHAQLSFENLQQFRTKFPAYLDRDLFEFKM
jgi:omega-amidase